MELEDVLRRRQMVRSFTRDAIDPASVEAILEAGLSTPTAGNCQGVDLVALVGEETHQHWDVTLPPARRQTFRWQGLLAAPLLIEVVADPGRYVSRYGEPDKAATGLGSGPDAWPVPFWHVDAGMASLAMLLQATAQGLGALFFGAFEHGPALGQVLGVPDGAEVVATVAVGHPAPDEPGRSASRDRRTDRLHRGTW